MAVIGDAKELEEVKKEKEDAMAEIEALKTRLKEKYTRDLLVIRTQLKQCQDELNLVCNEKKKLSDEMRAYARRWKEADREVVMVVEYAQEHPNEGSEAELRKKIDSLQQELEQLKNKYESTVALNGSEMEEITKKINFLEEQCSERQKKSKTLEDERQRESKMHSDLLVRILELERTIIEQKATLQDTNKQCGTPDLLNIASMKIANSNDKEK
ncbi:hypothetical protein EMCRGX_G018238 [Ephydatia muelleri]|eukprot:Em0012g644a